MIASANLKRKRRKLKTNSEVIDRLTVISELSGVVVSVNCVMFSCSDYVKLKKLSRCIAILSNSCQNNAFRVVIFNLYI